MEGEIGHLIIVIHIIVHSTKRTIWSTINLAIGRFNLNRHDYCRSSLVIADHRRSLLIIVNGDHYRSMLIIAYHRRSMPINADHH